VVIASEQTFLSKKEATDYAGTIQESILGGSCRQRTGFTDNFD